MVAEKGEEEMRPGDPEYQRQLDVITAIPSAKTDAIDLSGLSDLQMAEYESQHERDLRAQVRAFDERDKQIVVDEILHDNWSIVWNVLGQYLMSLYVKVESIRNTTQE